MRGSFVTCLSLLACICLLASPVQADSPSPKIMLQDGSEVQTADEGIIGSQSLIGFQSLTAKTTVYDLYKAKSALVRKAARSCSATVSLRSSGDGIECSSGDAECSCSDDCDRCDAGDGSCSCIGCDDIWDKIF